MNALGWGISATGGLLRFALTQDFYSGLAWFAGIALTFLILIYIGTFAKKK